MRLSSCLGSSSLKNARSRAASFGSRKVRNTCMSPLALCGVSSQRRELPIVMLSENGHSPWLLDVRDLDEWVNRTKTTV